MHFSWKYTHFMQIRWKCTHFFAFSWYKFSELGLPPSKVFLQKTTRGCEFNLRFHAEQCLSHGKCVFSDAHLITHEYRYMPNSIYPYLWKRQLYTFFFSGQKTGSLHRRKSAGERIALVLEVTQKRGNQWPRKMDIGPIKSSALLSL